MLNFDTEPNCDPSYRSAANQVKDQIPLGLRQQLLFQSLGKRKPDLDKDKYKETPLPGPHRKWVAGGLHTSDFERYRPR